MYIKINKRFSKTGGCKIFQFSVIESYRDSGKVKQRTLVYLAAISENAFKYVRRLESFWENSERKLKSFSETDRAQLVARLETIVPRPSEEMYAEGRRQMEALTATINRLKASKPLGSRHM
jgi:hypothetical protein